MAPGGRVGQHDFERANVYKINEINKYIYIYIYIYIFYSYVLYIYVCKYMLIFRYRSFAYIG